MTPVSDELIELGGLRCHFRDWMATGPTATIVRCASFFNGYRKRRSGVGRRNAL